MSSTSLRAPIADSRLINAVPSRAPIVVAIRHPAPLTRRDTSVHLVAVAVPITAFAWFLVTCWVAFAGGETSLNLAVITFLSVIFFGLIVGGGALSFDPTRGQVQQRTFKEFLEGSVDIATGRISGRTALLQTCLMPIVLAIGGTVIVGCAVAVGI